MWNALCTALNNLCKIQIIIIIPTPISGDNKSKLGHVQNANSLVEFNVTMHRITYDHLCFKLKRKVGGKRYLSTSISLHLMQINFTQSTHMCLQLFFNL